MEFTCILQIIKKARDKVKEYDKNKNTVKISKKSNQEIPDYFLNLTSRISDSY